jgi:hypothetical protein
VLCQVVEEVVDEVGGCGMPFAGAAEVTVEREVAGAVGECGEEGGDSFGVADWERAFVLCGGDEADEGSPAGGGGLIEVGGLDGPRAIGQTEQLRVRDGVLHEMEQVGAERVSGGHWSTTPACGVAFSEGAGGYGGEQVLLAGEMAIGRRPGDAGSGSDLAEGHRRGTALFEQFRCDDDEGLSCGAHDPIFAPPVVLSLSNMLARL